MSSQVDNSNSYPGKRARTDGGRREDDWTCPSCGNINFSFRTTCNMRNCTQSRPVNHNMASKAESSKGNKSKMPEGSWKCLQCNNINYPFRIKCNRQNCSADKPSEQNECSAVKPDEDDQ